MLVSSCLAPPEGDILEADKGMGVRDGSSGSGGSDNALAAAGEEVGVSDFPEALVVVEVNGGIDGRDEGKKKKEKKGRKPLNREAGSSNG